MTEKRFKGAFPLVGNIGLTKLEFIVTQLISGAISDPNVDTDISDQSLEVYFQLARRILEKADRESFKRKTP